MTIRNLYQAPYQLTHCMGHSSHFYFTYPGWYDQGRKIIISSDRENRTNFFGVDLTHGDITQLTDLDPVAGPVDAQGVTKLPHHASLAGEWIVQSDFRGRLLARPFEHISHATDRHDVLP
jgi:hypothetical protein